MKSKVAALSSPGKALPAADGSMTTLGGRLEALNIAFAGGNRDAYRGPLFTIPALGEHISGAILLDETIRRKIGGALIPGSVSERSEEHTSELQSPCNLVCRLLLEKKIRRPLAPGSSKVLARCGSSWSVFSFSFFFF